MSLNTKITKSVKSINGMALLARPRAMNIAGGNALASHAMHLRAAADAIYIRRGAVAAVWRLRAKATHAAVKAADYQHAARVQCNR